MCSLLLASPGASAETLHHFGVGIEGGARVVMQDATPDRGLGGQGHLGIDYRLQANHFLMSIGANVGIGKTGYHFNDRDIVLPHVVDQDGYDFNFVYQFSGHRFTHSSLNSQFSTLFGGTFSNVYFLIGPSLHIMPKHGAQSSAKVATYGDYPQFLDPFTGMPEHQYFSARPVSQSYALSDKGMFLSATFEVGYAIPLTGSVGNQHFLRVALYGDYAFYNLSKSSPSPWSDQLIETPTSFDWRDMYTPVRLNPLYGNWHPVTAQLSLGIKLAYAFVVPSAHHRTRKYPCMCLDDY